MPKRRAEILMEAGLQKTQACQWICRGFLRTLYPQEIGADQEKNRSAQDIITFVNLGCYFDLISAIMLIRNRVAGIQIHLANLP